MATKVEQLTKQFIAETASRCVAAEDALVREKLGRGFEIIGNAARSSGKARQQDGLIVLDISDPDPHSREGVALRQNIVITEVGIARNEEGLVQEIHIVGHI